MKKVLSLAVFTTMCFSLLAQKSDGYELKFKVRGAEDTTVYLANYFGSKLYYKDTARTDSKGEFIFEGSEELPTGKYAVVTPGPKYFEMFVQEQEFRMETDTSDFVKHMKVKNSPNNELLYNYIHFVIEKRLESERLNQELIKHASDSVKSNEVSQRLVDIGKEVKAYQKKVVRENPDLIAAKSLKLMIPVEVPDPPADKNGVKDSLFSYHYYLNHYFDHADLDDPNMVRLPEFHKKLDDYMNNALMKNPDSIAVYADKLVEKVEDTDELFQYVVQYITYNFETSQIMGMDAVFLHMAENYYQAGRATWADSTTLAKIDERVERMKPTMIGNVAPSLTLADTTLEKWVNAHELEAGYTILYFYDPDCGHCKKKTPILTERFTEYQDKGVIIIAVSGSDEKDWPKFIEKKGLDKKGIYNLTAPQRVYEDSEYATELILSGKTDYKSLNYRNTYDVFSTPKVFLLDEKKEIVAKQVGVEQVFDIIDDMEKRKKAN